MQIERRPAARDAAALGDLARSRIALTEKVQGTKPADGDVVLIRVRATD